MKALVGAFSVIVKLMDRFTALHNTAMEAREQEESSGWVAGMAIVITGLILIVSGGAASVGYYGEW